MPPASPVVRRLRESLRAREPNLVVASPAAFGPRRAVAQVRELACMSDVASETENGLDTETAHGWLSNEDLQSTRARVPIVYVDAVPVRVDSLGQVTEIGMLLRQAADGTLSRMVVSGRVLFGELLREALVRHCEKGPGRAGASPGSAEPKPVHRRRVLPGPGPFGLL